jgi:hypothetical protein
MSTPPRRPTFPLAKPPVSKIGPVSLDRSVAQAHPPSPDLARVDGRTLIYTFFTALPNVGEPTPILYNGDRLWARITLTLETAGPVSVGTISNLAPVLGGNGELLETDFPMTFDIYKGTRLYILSTGVNRIKVVVSPIPWLEMITGLLGKLVGRFSPTSSTKL